MERLYLINVRSRGTQLLDCQDGQMCGHGEDRVMAAASHCKQLLHLLLTVGCAGADLTGWGPV